MKTLLSPRPVNPLRRLRDDDGAVAISVAIAALVLFGVGALAVDIGNLYSVRRESQTSADLAALAGARELPGDKQAACKVAVAYLNDNKPGASGYGVNPGACSAGGALTNIVNITGDGLQISVRTPDQQVDFGLAGVFGLSHGATAASATVELRSPGRLLPFGLTLCKTLGFVVLKSNSGSGSGCASPSTGDFGYLDIPRATFTNNRLEYNIDLGVDHSVLPLTSTGTATPGTKCTSIVGAKSDEVPPKGNPVEGATCASVQTGLNASILGKSLIEHSNNACDGRLTRIPATTKAADKITFSGCLIDGTPFSSFLKSPATIASVTSASPATGQLDASILQNPNFFVVPVLYAADHPQNGNYGIVEMRGFYLECFESGGGGLNAPCVQGTSGPIKDLQGYAFKLDALVQSDANVGDTSIYYGGGTSVPVLIK